MVTHSSGAENNDHWSPVLDGRIPLLDRLQFGASRPYCSSPVTCFEVAVGISIASSTRRLGPSYRHDCASFFEFVRLDERSSRFVRLERVVVRRLDRQELGGAGVPNDAVPMFARLSDAVAVPMLWIRPGETRRCRPSVAAGCCSSPTPLSAVGRLERVVYEVAVIADRLTRHDRREFVVTPPGRLFLEIQRRTGTSYNYPPKRFTMETSLSKNRFGRHTWHRRGRTLPRRGGSRGSRSDGLRSPAFRPNTNWP